MKRFHAANKPPSTSRKFFFDLSCAPRVFTKPMITLLIELGITAHLH